MEEAVLWFILNMGTDISYKKDIRPIFQQRCIQCHSSGPLNWMEYNNAFKYKDQIKRRVWDYRSMPPGGFITEEEREKIRDWVNQGAKE